MIWFAAATAVFLYFTRPGWVTLVVAGLATAAVQPAGPSWIGASFAGLAPDTASPRLIIAAGLVAWAVRHRSWRMGVAAVVSGGLALAVDAPFVLALTLFTGAALAAGPRRPWQVAVTVVVAAALGLTYLGVVPGRSFVFAWPEVLWFAVGVAVLLVVVAPKPAWVALAIAGFGALAAYTVTLDPTFLARLCTRPGAVCGSAPGWFVAEDVERERGWLSDHAHAHTETLWFTPVWFVVAGVALWAVRRRSWRVAVAAVVFGVVLWAAPEYAAVPVFAAAAAAIGPRRNPFYLAGIGVLALALTDQRGPWTLVVTIGAVAVGLALGIWACLSKNGLNGAIAVVALAVAPLTPFLTAGVLLAAPVLRRAACWGGTPSRSPAP